MNLRLTTRIVLILVLLAAVLLAAVGALSYRSGSESLKTAAISEMLASAIEKEAALDDWIEERLADLRQIASQTDLAERAASLLAAAPGSDAVRSARRALVDELQPHVGAGRSGYIELFVMDPESGRVAVSTSPAEEGKSKAGHPYFDNGRNDLYLQPPNLSPDEHPPVMTAATPLRASDGKIVAVLGVRLDLAALNGIARRRTGLRYSDDAFLINTEQLPVTQPRFISEPVVLGRKLDTEAVRRCAARNSGVALTADYRGVPSIAVYRWNAKRQLGLIAKIDQSEALAPAREFGQSVLRISILALSGTAVLALLLARTITRPLRRLHERMRGFAKGETVEPLQASKGDEVSLLAREFDAMQRRVQERTAELAAANHTLLAENAERQRAEQRAGDALEYIRTIFEAMPVGLLTYTEEGSLVSANEAAARAVGATVEQLKMQNFRGIESWRKSGLLAGAVAALETREAKHLDLHFTTSFGKDVWLSCHLVPLFHGGQSKLLCILSDISDRHRAQEELRVQATAFDAAANAIVITDRAGTIQSVNPAFTKLTGYAAQEAIGENPRALKSGRHDHAFYRNLWKTIASGQVWSGELVNRRKDGTLYDEEMTITPVRNGDGAIVRYIAIKQDITERKKAEDALRESKHFIESIADSSTNFIYIFDLETGTNAYANRSVSEFLGLTREQIADLGVRFMPTITHPDDLSRVMRHFTQFAEVEDSRVVEIEYRVKYASGEWHTIWARNSVFTRRPDGTPWQVIGTAQDITARKEAEAALEKVNREMIGMSRQAGMAEVATTVLHNVGNVLNSVNVSVTLASERIRKCATDDLGRVVELLQQHSDDLPGFFANDPRGAQLPAFLGSLGEHFAQEQAALLAEMGSLVANVEHIKEIVAMQQTYARMAGVVETVSPASLLEDAVRLNAGALERHGVQVVREFETDLPPVTVDRHKVIQVLVNLIRNAKYALDESAAAEKRLTLRVAVNGGGHVKISVADTGVGIPAENLPRLFEYGFTTRRDGHGFGLHGGALAAKELGGSLTAHSDGLGKGATFTLELPPQLQPNIP